MQLHRVVLNWQGPQINGAAVSVLHFAGDNPLNSVAAIKGAVDALAPILPVGVSITTPATGDTIEDTTGSLVNTWSATGGGITAGAASTDRAAAGVGGCISWYTGGIVVGAGGKGRRLRGRTFIAPIQVDYFDTNGTLRDNCLTAINAFGTQLQAAGPLAVWHRPSTVGGSNGTSYGVLSHRVRDKVAVLRSRRD